ncbi:hypothetical protein GPECTOR_56g396 [Gonium pectorale]|uniref:Uncharacterized protein n=1 Tax=Gonium pectorale TaxID=33097 RepID=A0A150G7I1_GONPE|nr:hypothetical protein GPECTOR_56g396 [Gonium pectorale]|eukprot:KXZ45300.1 hypothetical protein GPECTOR_56g396 [Gonium pectorale]
MFESLGLFPSCNPPLSTWAAAAPAAGPGPGPEGPAPLTNHPLEYDPVTNEHTAKMTLARNAALEFYNAGKYAQAEAKFREAVAEAQLGFEPGDPHIASAKNNLAEFLRNTGRWDEAERLYKEALDLLERNFGEKHWLFVSALHNLALSYESRGQLDAARSAMERVVALRLAMFGPRHFLYADSLFALGHMLRAVPGRGREALSMMMEAVRLLEEAEKVQVNVVLHMLTEVAACHSADGNPGAAAAALRRALAHLATERGDDSAAASALSEQLVEAAEAAGRPAEAAAVAGAALAARRRMFGEGSLVVATSELRVAQSDELGPAPAPAPAADGPGPALRALQHADSAFRIAAAAAEECAKRGLLSGPSDDKLLKRLRAAHAMGSAAKLMATLAGVPEPATAPPQVPEAPATATAAASSSTARVPSRSWWPFGGGRGADEQRPAADEGGGNGPAAKAAKAGRAPLAEPVAELALADRRLEAAAAALTAATRAGRDLMQAVGSGRRQLPRGLSADELAGLLVESQLQLLDVLERLGLVLQAHVAAGQGQAAGRSRGDGKAGSGGGEGDVVARHRAVLEQQERVAAELLG